MSPSSPDLPQHRPAHVEDETAIVTLMRDFYTEEHLAFDEPVARRAIRELLADPRLGLILLLEAAGKVVGHAVITFGFSLEFHGRYALLDELYLIPSVRGRGWGQRALDIVVTTARSAGVAALRLEVNHANLRVRSLYLAARFSDDRRDLYTHWLH